MSYNVFNEYLSFFANKLRAPCYHPANDGQKGERGRNAGKDDFFEARGKRGRRRDAPKLRRVPKRRRTKSTQIGTDPRRIAREERRRPIHDHGSNGRRWIVLLVCLLFMFEYDLLVAILV